MAGAPECCGLLVALNVDFDSTIKDFQKHASEGKIFIPSAVPGPRRKIMTVETSRLAMLKAKEEYPLRRASFQRKHYWCLRLNDSEWLFEHFPETIKTSVPSLTSDREVVLTLLADQRAGLIHPSKVKEVPAGLRAQIRDSVWFEAQRTSARIAMNENISVARKAVFSNRAAALEKALSHVLEIEQRPSRITSRTLAAITNLSCEKVAQIIRAYAPLRHRIAKANEDKKRRQLLWAALQLQVEGGRLSKRQIGKRAGLPTAEVSDGIFREICCLYFPRQR